ncbi:hypothetical protein N7478_001799 [Penicillium angulare]|uniref:uncharacterized protein n=1 Tax=Penicillium angulare TaxID=116970 RepID=UPI002540ABAF|nr:uncharacterized protein N7478_001799 [Penicillium angulare]KAJ5288769.1 hypothetical protein N7478_001799 [Penicillium angulare]
MKFINISALAISLASTAFAWKAVDYHGTTDCNIIGNTGFWRAYNGTDSGVCHNFDSGDSTSTCQQRSMADGLTDCGSGNLVSASVATGSDQCEFFESIDCAGYSRTIDAGTCVTGVYRSFSCPEL